MKHILISLITLLAIPTFAQRKDKISWRQHLKVADELYLKSLYADAAEHYESAFRKKTKKKEIIAKAAECYYITRDYKKAASAYRHIKDKPKEFPLGRLRYARSLKQSGKFDDASREFVYFIENYEGEDKGVLNEIVQGEIRGCEEAIKIMAAPRNNQVEIFHLSTRVNSPETEFAPIPFNDKVLYYSSNMAEKARIYLTMRNEDGTWKKATLPKNFPSIPDQHFCNGSLAPDGQRFYFTICESKENWGGLTTTCEIYVIKKESDSWSDPERLHDYINKPGSTSTQPFIIHEYNKEFLYFSSNRDGGIGGMDLWYSTRSLDSPDIDFTVPVNLGNKINTLGDEITPYYDMENGDLYFSSNGQPTMGGQDIFKATGEKSTWTTPENLALPYNTTADDYYYIQTPNSNRGFLVSNRVFGVEKIRTTHEDIFEFVVKSDNPVSNISVPTSRNVPVTSVAKIEEPVEEKVIDTPVVEIQTTMVQSAPIVTEEVATTIVKKESTPTTAPIIEETLVETEFPETTTVIETVAPEVVEKPIATSTSSPLIAGNDVLINGVVSDFNNTTINKVLVSVYEIMESNGQRLIENKYFENGNYEFSLPPNGDYLIQVRREGYKSNEIGVSTRGEKFMSQNISIEQVERLIQEQPHAVEPIVLEEPKINTSPTESPAVVAYQEESTYTEPAVSSTTTTSKVYEDMTYITKGISKRDNLEYSTRAPRHGGAYYKIQLIADKTFSPSAPKFANLQHLGRYDTEYLSERGIYRVLLADFFSLESAKEVLQTVKENGFKRAFVVKYIDGERLGMFYR